MHLMTGETALLGFMTGAGLLVWKGWNWTMLKRKQKILEEVAFILEGAYTIRRHTNPPQAGEGNGEVAVALLGSYGTGTGPQAFEGFVRTGNTAMAGGTLLAQLTHIERKQCLNAINPIFHDRITVVDCPTLPGGLQGRTYEEAIGDRELWYNDLSEAVHSWIRSLSRRDTELLIVVVSPGGHLALVQPIISIFKNRYPKKPVYVLTILDDREVVRERFPILRSLIAAGDLVRGTIVMDNTRFKARSDRGITTFLTGLAAGNATNRASDQLANVLSYVFATTRQVRYATISTWAETVPINYLPDGDIYYTKVSSLEEQIVRGVKTVLSDPSYQSVPLAAAPAGHYRHIEVILPLAPEEFAKLERRVLGNVEPWLKETDTEVRISFASFGYDLTPETTDLPILVVLLQPLSDDGSGLDDYATPKQQPILPVTPPSTVAALSSAQPVRTRGRPKGT